jgi:hypothetical protein
MAACVRNIAPGVRGHNYAARANSNSQNPLALRVRRLRWKKKLCFPLWMKAFGIAPALLAEVAF